MIVIREMSKISTHDYNARKDKILIDLTNCLNIEGAIRHIGINLKGQDSPEIQGRSIDALYDVVSDWAIENIGSKKYVTIIDGKMLLRANGVILPKIVACLADSVVVALKHLSATNKVIEEHQFNNLNIELFV